MSSMMRARANSPGTALILLMLFLCSCHKGTQAYQRAQKDELNQQLDAAHEQYDNAQKKDPKNAEYQLKTYQMRFEAAQFHVRQGITHLEHQENELAQAEFETALKIDPSFMLARQELEYTKHLLASAPEPQQSAPPVVEQKKKSDMPPQGSQVATTANEQLLQQAQQSASPVPEREQKSETAPQALPIAASANEQLIQQPPALKPLSREPITLKMYENAQLVFRTLGKLAGVNVIFDPEFPDRKISIDLTNVTIQQALEVGCIEAKAFWKPLTSNIIMILPDTSAKRKQEEEQVLKKIYLQHAQTPQELTDITTGLQQMLELHHVQALPRDNAILIRDTPAKVLLASELIGDSDRGKSEVVVQISVLQARRDRARSLGIQPGSSTTLAFAPVSPLGPAGAVALDKLGQISSGDFALTIPSATAAALMSDSTTRIIQNPQVRVSDGESAKLRVGDRVPVATGSFQTTAGLGPVVNTQFQYVDVGVNIDLVPHVHPDHSVSLKLAVEVSSLNGQVNIGGVDQPVISQRRIEHEIRLQEGEVSILGGLVEHSQNKSVTGWPGLSHLPLLRYLFSGEDVSNTDNEVLIVVTPKLVRSRDFERESLQALSVGTDSELMLRSPEDALAPVALNPEQSSSVQASAAAATPVADDAPETRPQLSLDPATLAIKPGETAKISVKAANIHDLFSASLLFHYDPKLLSVEDVRHGDFMSGGTQEVAIVQRIDKEKGQAAIFATRQPNTAGVDGTGTLLTLMVKRLADGPASLQMTEAGTRNARQKVFPIKITDGKVTLP
jgi:general secretion pathway protein D